MRINESVIYLTEPLFGRKILTGPVTVLTTWLDYTFTEELTAAELGLPEGESPPTQVRVLIPLNNVIGVIAEADNEAKLSPRIAALERI